MNRVAHILVIFLNIRRQGGVNYNNTKNLFMTMSDILVIFVTIGQNRGVTLDSENFDIEKCEPLCQ